MAEVIVTEIDLLRHGACEGGEIFRGSTNVALSGEGWQQMHDKVASVADAQWQHIVSSPLQRCHKFAEQLSEGRELPMSVNENLREVHFGDWEGLSHQDAQQRYPEHWRSFWRSPDSACPPNGEAMPDFSERICTVVDELALQYQGQSLLVVAHGAVIRVAMCHWLGIPMAGMTRLAVPYAGLSRFKIYQQAGRSPWMQLCSHY